MTTFGSSGRPRYLAEQLVVVAREQRELSLEEHRRGAVVARDRHRAQPDDRAPVEVVRPDPDHDGLCVYRSLRHRQLWRSDRPPVVCEPRRPLRIVAPLHARFLMFHRLTRPRRTAYASALRPHASSSCVRARQGRAAEPCGRRVAHHDRLHAREWWPGRCRQRRLLAPADELTQRVHIVQHAGRGRGREQDESHVDGFDDQQSAEHRDERLLPAPPMAAPPGDHPQQQQRADGHERHSPREVALPAVRELVAESSRRPRLRVGENKTATCWSSVISVKMYRGRMGPTNRACVGRGWPNRSTSPGPRGSR